MHSCNSKITNVTCKTLRSEQGQEYSIQTSFDTRNSKSFSQTISWQKDETRCWIDLRHDQVQKYQDESWADVIDSFVPTSYGEEFGEVSRHISG